MKKILAMVAVVAIMGLNVGQVKADDDWGWFAAGAVTGVVTGAILADAPYHSHYDGYGHYGYGGGYHGGYTTYTTYYPSYPRPYYRDRYCHRHYPGCGHSHYEEYYY